MRGKRGALRTLRRAMDILPTRPNPASGVGFSGAYLVPASSRVCPSVYRPTDGMRDFGMAGDWLLARSARLLGLEGRAGDLIALLLGHLEKALALAGIGAAAAIRGARALAFAGIRSHASPHGVVGMRGGALSRDGHDEGGYGY